MMDKVKKSDKPKFHVKDEKCVRIAARRLGRVRDGNAANDPPTPGFGNARGMFQDARPLSEYENRPD